jgi:hypothetical protein
MITDPEAGSTYSDLHLITPSLYLEHYVTLMTEDSIILRPKGDEYQQGILLYNYLSGSYTRTVTITNTETSQFELGITTSSSYIPADDYDLVTVAYMRDNAGGKAIFRRWA